MSNLENLHKVDFPKSEKDFIHALLLFLGLFLKISRWVPLQWSAYRPCQGLGSHIDEKSTAWEITVGLYENLMSNNFRDGCPEKMWIET